MVEMRTVRVLPGWQPAAHLFPDGQVPNSGACGQCPLREDGRKWMVSEGTPDPKPTWSHSKRMITKGTVRFYNVCVYLMPQWPPNARKSIEQVVLKTWIRFPEQKSRPFRDTWLSKSCGYRGGVVPGVLWPVQRHLVQVQGESQDGEDGKLLLLLILLLSYVWLWFSVGDVLTLSWLLGYSSKLETLHR